ncbi:MAG: hypothetical protein ACXWAT_17105, partial [Methylobacter sp.]
LPLGNHRNCNRRPSTLSIAWRHCSRSLFPTRFYLGNRSMRCSTSCIHAVVPHPWGRTSWALQS